MKTRCYFSHSKFEKGDTVITSLERDSADQSKKSLAKENILNIISHRKCKINHIEIPLH